MSKCSVFTKKKSNMSKIETLWWFKNFDNVKTNNLFIIVRKYLISILFYKMNSRHIFSRCNKLLIQQTITRGNSFKIVKRPDPKTLKMPAPGTAPSIMAIIKEKIRLNGPITVAEYMHIITTNPTEGYYMKKEVIGQGGDFITSPEISQLFGEILGVWFFSETQKLGPSKPLQIVELGPGNATLLLDILRVSPINHLSDNFYIYWNKDIGI